MLHGNTCPHRVVAGYMRGAGNRREREWPHPIWVQLFPFERQMTSRERVVTALRCEEPDRVPSVEIGIDRALAEHLMGWGDADSQAMNLEENFYTAQEALALADRLGLDSLSYVKRAPVFAEKLPGQDGRLFYGEGQIREMADLDKLSLPDPNDDSLYEDAERFVENKGERAACFVTRIGIFPTMLSMGMERFSVALFENRDFVEAVLDWYCDWMLVLADRMCDLGFDVFVSTDDLAFNTAPFFSPEVFRDVVLPRYRKISEVITIPWIIHSDGNLLPFVDDLLTLGISGLHPLEKGAMDIRSVKREYGDRLCLLGNVDLNLLGMGTPEEVEAEVRGLIEDVGPGGGYILSSGNSLAGYLLPENVMAMSSAGRKYGTYPIEKGRA